MESTASGNSKQTTSHKVVLPFYLYAAAAFLAATLLLLWNAPAFMGHYFQPPVLTITHLMALGWGVMIILGASHQLVPVLVESALYSETLAWLSFICAAAGIPLLAYGFYRFDMGWPAEWGGSGVILAILLYLINLWASISKSKTESVQAVYIFTAGVWLLVTTVIGLALVLNFTRVLLPEDSLHYLPLHAHTGIIGWFVLMVMGVGSRLIPMFLISKYENTRLLWWIYGWINVGLLGFLYLFLVSGSAVLFLLPWSAIAVGTSLFGYYCYRAFKDRIRRNLDAQMKISLLSVMMLALPGIIVVILIVELLNRSVANVHLILEYGFATFFGWLTAIILGMTFKTLPFIVWNKVYHSSDGAGGTPNPKDLFDGKIFYGMAVSYLAGFILFLGGIFWSIDFVLQGGAALLLVSAILYSWNILIVMTHKAAKL